MLEFDELPLHRDSPDIFVGARATEKLRNIPACRSGDVLVVTDEHIAIIGSSLRRVQEVLSQAGMVTTVHRIPIGHLGTLMSASRIADGIRASRPTLCVALGGGAVIDATKLARAAQREPWLLDQSIWSSARGLLNPPISRTLEGESALVAVSTRPGSAAHVSDRVCLSARSGHTRRLVAGRTLLPTAVIADPEHGLTLGCRILAETICEVLSRGIEPYLVTERSSRKADRVGGWIVVRTLKLGESLMLGNDLSSTDRVSLEWLTIATMAGAHIDEWEPSAHPWWCIQNTIAASVPRSKGSLTAQALPSILERVWNGDERFGRMSRWKLLERHTGLKSSLGGRVLRFLADVRQQGSGDGTPHRDQLIDQWSHEAVSLWAGLVPWIGRTLKAKDISYFLRDAGF
ncbi:iron-containing alcohol dehydrogenase [Natronosporangium hydrolyticum]|uniref:Iron-containing alcohol dehydrogenase n=1 Tax=Natronosporangium hydrolyticum TaxID=2811111 RepID=A0A895YI07_9ACTN|nr:iron-containing alcohol dehydrogenase [Natronosporangium hydrolyticum]